MQHKLFTTLTGLEQKLLQAEVRANALALDRLIDESFVEFGASGRMFRKSEILCRTPNLPQLEYVPADFKVTELIPGLAQLSFRLRTINPVSGEVNHSMRSSIWRRSGHHWKLVFQQGLPAAAS